jgi:hypothetical protein
MYKIQIVLMCAACLFFVASTVTAQKAKNTMTNADVVEMVKAGLLESTIVLAIQQSEPNFDTSAKALIELSKQGVSQKSLDAMLQTQPTKSVPQNTTDTANTIATKNIGSLRVVLKSVLPLTLNDGRSGVRCAFEFINLETQKPIVVAMNAVASDRSFPSLGNYLRSTLVDDSGGLWRLQNSDVAGMSIVGVGVQNPYGPYYNPAEIVTVLSKRDDLNSDVGKGTSAMGVVGEYRFIFGSTTEMSAEQSLTVSMTFVQDANQTPPNTPPKVFQLATEIVVGIAKASSKKSYTLYNLTFDRVNLPAQDSPR